MEVDLAEVTATAHGDIKIKGIGKVGTGEQQENRTLTIPTMTSTNGNIQASNFGSLVISTAVGVSLSTGTIDLRSVQEDLVINVSNGNTVFDAHTLIL